MMINQVEQKNRGASHYKNLRDLRIAMHSREYDAASAILDICQSASYSNGQLFELVAPIARSAAKRMLYHLKAMHELRLAESDQV